MIKADWTCFEFAKANHELNESYFQTNEHKKFPSYFKIKEALQWIISEEKDNSKLSMLDVGCGTGWQAEYFRLEGLFDKIEYTGSDISTHMCDFAKKNCSSGNFIVSDIIQEIPGIFDIVSEAALLELLDDWKKAVSNIIKCSNKWIIFHRLFFTEGETYVEQVVTYNNAADLRYHISLKELGSFLNSNGFSIVKEDVWITEPYKMGTFIAKRIRND